MTLTTHAIFGAAVAQLTSVNPVIGFLAGFMSHFVLDAIPHGHYPIISRTRHPEDPLKEDMPFGKDLFFDLLKIGFDFWLGVALAVIIFQTLGSPRFPNIIAGVIGGVLPDALQFAYFRIRSEPLTSLQRFHSWIHTEIRLDDQIPKAIFVEGSAIVLAVFAVKELISF